MKQYKDLNLKKIREECNLDFAHYTYGKDQCSCCYGPLDMAARYWKNGKKPVKVYEGRCFHYELDGKRFDDHKFSYILFKNAWNGGGRIKNKEQKIEDYTCIKYRFDDEEQKIKVCNMLLQQLDEDYVVCVPNDDSFCILILFANSEHLQSENVQNNFNVLKFC